MSSSKESLSNNMASQPEIEKELPEEEKKERASPVAGPAGEGAAPAASSSEPATEALPSPKELEDLRNKAAERDDFLSDLQRARADYINLQRRTARDRETWSSQAIQKFATDLLPILDQLDMAIASANSSQDFKTLLEGILLTRDSCLALLRQHKLEVIQTQQRFDPALHEAVIQEERPGLPDLAILEELRRGYTLNGKVLRPAQVKVSKNPGEAKGLITK